MAYSTEKLEQFQWPVSVTRIIQGSPEQIWSTISKPGYLEDCHPYCESNPVLTWHGVGSVDTVNYFSGWAFQRKFVNWIDGVGYDLLIGQSGGRKSYVSWRISAAPEDCGTLGITVYPHVLQNIPGAIRWIPHIVYLQPALSRYLEAVVKGVEWFLISGIPVKKNQFGFHAWFSGKDT